MTDTDRMVAWLGEAMDAAGRDAEAATAATGGPHWHGSDNGLYSNDVSNHPGPFLADAYGYTDPQVVAHVTRNDPAAVLRRIATDRKLLDLHVQAHECSSWDEMAGEFNNCQWVNEWESCSTVRLLAEGYGWKEDQ